jgi:hypothetical protein
MELKGRQVLKIKTISTGNKYKVDEGHPFYGQTFNIYQYDGKVFNVKSTDEFVEWRDKGILFSVDFKETSYEKEVDGQMTTIQSLALLNCTNVNQEVAMAKTESILNRIYRDVETVEVDDDVLSQLTA